MKKIILIIFFCPLSNIAQNQDTIFEKDRSIIPCTINKIENDHVYFRRVYNLQTFMGQISLSEVKKISLSKSSKNYLHINLDSLKNISGNTILTDSASFKKIQTEIDFERNQDNMRYFPTNSFYLELSGNYSLYTINYERVLFQDKKNAMHFRVGIGYFPIILHIITAPITISYQRRIVNGVFLETGTGINILYEPDSRHSSSYAQLILHAGIRFLIGQQFLIRINYCPKINLSSNEFGFYSRFPFYIGLSLGRSWGLK